MKKLLIFCYGTLCALNLYAADLTQQQNFQQVVSASLASGLASSVAQTYPNTNNKEYDVSNGIEQQKWTSLSTSALNLSQAQSN